MHVIVDASTGTDVKKLAARATQLVQQVPGVRDVVLTAANFECVTPQAKPESLAKLGCSAEVPYLTCTVHRAENTTPEVLPGLVRGLVRLAEHYPLLWPVHPRTRRLLEDLKLPVSPRIALLPPVGYLAMLALLSGARALCTDSGGLQEEAYALGTPVLILRNETEWIYLLDGGCAVLLGNREEDIGSRGQQSLVDLEQQKMRQAAQGLSARLQDGGAAERILAAVTARWL